MQSQPYFGRNMAVFFLVTLNGGGGRLLRPLWINHLCARQKWQQGCETDIVVIND